MMLWAGADAAYAGTDEVRLAVVVSSNRGLDSEEPLVYADQDARRVADVLQTLGGYGPGDVWVVPEARVDDLFSTLTRVTVRAQEVATAGGRPSLLLFYAGHAGTDGLHLGGEVLPLPDLKSAIRVVPAADRIVVLDACHAGTIARSRGATLVEVSDRPVGFEPPRDEAWIASSGPEERSFEVEDRRGALFTHFFLSAARGAADADVDHRVTLGELYTFVRAQTTAAAADLGQLQEPRWAGDLGSFALTDLGASATGVRVVGPVDVPLLVIDEEAELVVAEVPRGGGASLALPAGAYQVVAAGPDGAAVGRLTVPGDGWTVWHPDQQLSRARGVRTRGGLYDLTPWAVAAGYGLGLGTTPGRLDAHSVYVGIERELGRGHAVEVAVAAGWMPHGNAWWAGADTLVDLRLGWTREVVGGPVAVAPGVALTLGGAEHRTERAPHPVWGAWYGSDVDDSRVRRATASVSAGVALDLDLGAVAIGSWWGVGVGGRSGERAGLVPAATGRLGLAVPFR
jgi:hypothetical protein